MNKVSRDKLTLHTSTYAHHLFLEALVLTFKGDTFGEFLSSIDWNNKEEIECYFVVEGTKIPFLAVCEEWQSQVKEMITERAFGLIEEQLSGLQDTLNDIKINVLRDVAKKLGIEVDLYNYL